MRAYDNGSFFTVAFSRLEVENFAARWPCFGERRAIAFQFDKRNGDLVDIMPSGADENMDGSAVCAMADDAKAYGFKRFKIAV